MRDVIIVDDDAFFVQALVSYLEGEKYARLYLAEPDPKTKSLFVSATRLLEDHPQALFLIDLYMPNVNGEMSFRTGIDLVSSLRAHPQAKARKQQFTILTAHLDLQNRKSNGAGPLEDIKREIDEMGIEIIDKPSELNRIAELLGVPERDRAWAYEHQAELNEKYPGQVLAIWREQVVGSGADAESALKDASERNKFGLYTKEELVYFALPDPTIYDWETKTRIPSPPGVRLPAQQDSTPKAPSPE